MPIVIIGLGIDIVEVKAIEYLLADSNNDFIMAWFSPAERVLAPTGTRGRSTYFAGRLAAKEAVAKALGTGLIGEMAWTDIAILREPSGAPTVNLSGETGRIAKTLQIAKWLVSISHTESYAVASAIAVGGNR